MEAWRSEREPPIRENWSGSTGVGAEGGGRAENSVVGTSGLCGCGAALTEILPPTVGPSVLQISTKPNIFVFLLCILVWCR